MYYAKVNWFDCLDEEDKCEHMFVCATDWNDAMAKVSSQFELINSIEIVEVCNDKCSVVFVPEEFIEKIKEYNVY